MQHFKPYIATCILLIMAFVAQAQQDNRVLYLSHDRDSVSAGELGLQVDMLGYFKNNEYFTETLDGYTLFGYQLPVALNYQISEEWSVIGGTYLLKDFGKENFTEIAPLFSLRYTKGPWFFAFGTLDGSLNHRLIEPLYDFENRLTDPLENGVQIKYEDSRLFADVWVDWQQAIFPGDEGQEVIIGGLSAAYDLVASEDIELSIPVQLVLGHRGGQTNTANDDPVLTMYNLASGLKFTRKEGGWVQEWGLQPYYALYGGNIPEEAAPFTNGSGYYLNGHVKGRWATAMISYWSGSDYIPVTGGDLYSSASRSVVNPLATDADRDILILRFMKDVFTGDGIRLSGRIEPFWTLDDGAFDISYGLYVAYTGGFRLAKVK